MNRRLSGKKAKTSGMLFETFIKGMCAIQGISCLQIPSGCKWLSKTRVMPVRTPFDMFIGYEGKSVFLDAKSTLGETFPYSAIDQDQLDDLITASRGGRAGYIIRMPSGIWFADTSVLLSVKPRESVDFQKCLYLGDNVRCDFRRIF